MNGTALALCVAAFVAAAAPAPAQTAVTPPAPRAFAVRAFGETGFERFTATKSFTAILGQNSGPVYGGGGEVLFGGWFLRVAGSRFKKDGERAIRVENRTFRLGIPLTITIVPVEASGGYRFRRHSRLIPYAGGGISSHSYKETSAFAEGDENVSDRFTGYQVLGGVEYRIGEWIGVAGEVQYSAVPDAIGGGGLSQEFGETDLGGTTVRVRFVVGR
jgi:opacity protein-like surface antigen